MENSGIQKYLSSIRLPMDELYIKILDHKLNPLQLRESGFPTDDPNHPDRVTLCTDSFFSSSQDPAEQVCRCGKTVCLLEKEWYKDEAGCSYHLGKRIFCDGPENGLFSCCKSVSQKNGCAHHTCHVSSFRPVEESFVFTKTKFSKRVASKSPKVFALDCEMVFTTAGMEVVKVSVVSVTGDLVYHSFVRPSSPVLDFNTAFSGVSAEDLDHVATKLSDVQTSLLEFLNKDSILVGHGLENDLLGLRLLHENIVDTSILYAHERGFPMRHSLKYLASRYLNRTIHVDGTGHDSVEDAMISLELVLHKIYLETLNIPFVIQSYPKHKYEFYVPFILPIPYTFNGIAKPMILSHFGNYGSFPRCQLFRYCGWRDVYKYVQFETPVFPVVPAPPSVVINFSDCSSDSEEQLPKTCELATKSD